MEWLNTNSRTGFSLVEVLLSAAMLAFLVTALVGALIVGRESVATSGAQNRAIFLAEEGLEAARDVRKDAYANLTDGMHGVVMSTNKWVFSGNSDTTDIFTRVITVSAAGTNRKQVTSTVTWPQTVQRPGSVSVITYLSNWQQTNAPINSCTSACLIYGYSTGTCRPNANACSQNGEINVPEGALVCQAENPLLNVCCCQP